jgi:phosphotransferase system enzyme I (PtsP)
MTIVARAMGVPVVGRLNDIRHSVNERETILVDGDNGSVIMRPNRQLTSGFDHRMALSQKRRAQYAAVAPCPRQPAMACRSASWSMPALPRTPRRWR